MLKIVDYYPNSKIPFPLKELEKFGFEDSSNSYIKVKANANWVVRKKDRIIEFDTCYGLWTRALTDLFDLIQAGLVEKVEG